MATKMAVVHLQCIPVAGICLEAIGEAKVEWMTSSDIQASDEEVFNHTTVLPIKGTYIYMLVIAESREVLQQWEKMGMGVGGWGGVRPEH